MSDSTYTAHLIGASGTETLELELIGGLPQKSIVRDGGEAGDVVWELVDGADTSGPFEYRQEGVPGADYS
ncbi:MAG: hypothetical protein JWM50_2606 [Microbacteriaceae bacterium]|jgi:hypothetical protein|nr:hypothetical protein [Microbacteriaceae bacterium]